MCQLLLLVLLLLLAGSAKYKKKRNTETLHTHTHTHTHTHIHTIAILWGFTIKQVFRGPSPQDTLYDTMTFMDQPSRKLGIVLRKNAESFKREICSCYLIKNDEKCIELNSS